MVADIKKYLSWILAVLVIVYAVWIAFPVLKAFVLPDTSGAGNVPVMSADDTDYNAGGTMPMDGDNGPHTMESIQGQTAVDAIETHNTPVIVLWGAVIVFYIAAAFLHASGSLRGAAVYLLGFVADAVLTYLTNGNKGGGVYDKILDILSQWDPRYVLTLVAMVLGFLMYLIRFRPKTAEALAERLSL